MPIQNGQQQAGAVTPRHYNSPKIAGDVPAAILPSTPVAAAPPPLRIGAGAATQLAPQPHGQNDVLPGAPPRVLNDLEEERLGSSRSRSKK